MPNDIIFDDVSLERGGTHVLTNLNFRSNEKRVGLVGANGSGKSSLANLITGLLAPTKGTVTVFGLDTIEARAQLPQKVGFIFQNSDHQIVFPTVLEEIAFSFEMSGTERKQAPQAAEKYLRDQGLDHWADRPVHTLSEGQKQWLCILAVLAMQPNLLIFDEPFASLDLRTRNQLLQRIEQLDQQVLMISHDPEVMRTYDRVIWLEAGKIRKDGAPDDVLSAYHAAANLNADNWLC